MLKIILNYQKKEQILFCNLTQFQCNEYKKIINNNNNNNNKNIAFKTINILRKTCNHQIK